MKQHSLEIKPSLLRNKIYPAIIRNNWNTAYNKHILPCDEQINRRISSNDNNKESNWEVKVLCTKNYKTRMKAMKEDTKNQKDILCLWIGKHAIVKMSILPKGIYKFSATSIKNPTGILQK